MIHNLDSIAPEIITDGVGNEVARRYDIAAYMAERLGQDWQVVIEEVFEQRGSVMTRNIDDHYTNVDLGEGTPRTFTTEVIDSEILEGEFGQSLMNVYRDQRRLIQVAAEAVGIDDSLGLYNEVVHAINPIFRQFPLVGSEEEGSSPSLEPHIDGRYSGVIVVRAPKHEGGELIILDRDNTPLSSIRHEDGTLVCLPSGVYLPHYTMPLLNPNDTRIVMPTNYPKSGETDTERDSVTSIGAIGG